MKLRMGRRWISVALSAFLTTGVIPQIAVLPAQAAETKARAFQYAENGGGAYTDAYQNVCCTPDGGFVVSGYTFGNSNVPEWNYESDADTPSGKHTNNDAVLIKYDKDHRIQWSKAYGGTGVEVFESMDILNDGRIAVCGRQSFTSTDSKIKGVSWNILLIDPNDPDSYEIYHIGGSAGDQAYGISAAPDGGFVVGGWSASKEGYITSSRDKGVTWTETKQLWEAENGTNDSVPNRLAPGGTDSVIVKINQDGGVDYCTLHNYEITEQSYNITNPSERLTSLNVDADGNILITGYGSVAKNVQNAVVAKIDGTDGSLIWHRSAGNKDMTVIPENKIDYIKAEYIDLAEMADGSYVVTGSADNDATTDEKWTLTAEKDTIVVHYAKDGSVISAESFGRAGDSNSRPEGVTATPDGGYIVNGSQSGILYEDEKVKKGYNWGSYGAQDAILVKYTADDQVEWAENYGTTGGDWINGVAVSASGQILAVGESNGKYGNPSYGNHGGIDGIVMISDGTSEVVSEDAGVVEDGDVVWADGEWVGIGNGYGGDMEIHVKVADHKITGVDSYKDSETDGYYYRASSLYSAMINRQTVNLDTVSGATLSSNGMLEGARRALNQAAAKTVDDLVTQIEAAGTEDAKTEAVKAAADAYSQLGSNSRDALRSEEALKTACAACGVELKAKGDKVQLKEVNPEPARSDLTFNDTYYKIQDEYYSNIHAEALTENGYTGKGVRIAVIDSGIAISHQDLDISHILGGWDYGDGKTYDAETNPGSRMKASQVYDNNGHGTAVAGILQAKKNNQIGIAGLLGEADLIPLRVIPASSKKEAEKISSSKQVAQAILDAVDEYHVDVITTSLDVVDTEELRAAVAYAAKKNVIITAASGNSSTAESTGEDAYIYPAAYDTVIGVGAVDKNNQVRTSSQKNDQVFVTAPGENIAVPAISRGVRCDIKSGTSYASPVVAAMAAAAKQNVSDLSVDHFKSLLKASVRDAGEEGYDTSYGHGVIDMQAFVTALNTDAAAMSRAALEESAKKAQEEADAAKADAVKAQKEAKKAQDEAEAAKADATRAQKEAKNAQAEAEAAKQEAEAEKSEAEKMESAQRLRKH